VQETETTSKPAGVAGFLESSVTWRGTPVVTATLVEQQNHLQRRYTSTKPYGVTFQKTGIFLVTTAIDRVLSQQHWGLTTGVI
jgi:hypothetical protein